jgi:GNAT superfamily N-acetyltransferase
MIRRADNDDVGIIVEMSKKFYVHTSYYNLSKIEMNEEDVGALARHLISSGLMHVAEVDGRVVGMIGVILIPFMFNADHVHAGEVIWWVEPEAQSAGIGKALLASIEGPAKAAGATHIQMVDLVTSGSHVAKLYEAFGYQLTERAYTKVI